jgi:O-antigen/teichoic acid export membrane protein
VATSQPDPLAGPPLARAATIYVFSSGAAGAVNFLLMVVLTHLLTKAEYGVVGLLTATIGILGVVVGLNPQLLITVRFPVRSREQLKPLLSSMIPVTLVTALLALAVLEGLRAVWTVFRFPHWVLLALAVSAVFGVALSTGLTVLQMQGRPGRYGTVQLGGVVLGALVTLLLVAGLDFDWRGKLLGDVIGLSAAGLVMTVFLVRSGYLGLSFRVEHLREVVAFSAPLVIHGLAFWAINAQDRYFVTWLVGLEANGLYTAAYAFGNVLNILHAGILKAYTPFFYERARIESQKPRLARLTLIYFVLSLVGWGLFVAVVWLVVPFILGEEFRAGFAFIPWVALGYTFNAVRNFMAGYLYLAERTRLISGLTLGAAVLNGILNYVLILRWGAIGAAVATAITFGLLAAVTAWFAVRSWPMPWREAFRRREE